MSLPDIPMFDESVLRAMSAESSFFFRDIQSQGLRHQKLLNKIAMDRRARA